MVIPHEQLVAEEDRKSMTTVTRPCCNGSYGDANVKANARAGIRVNLAHESCQTSLSMAEMQVVSSLAQLVCCEPCTDPLRGGRSPLVYISNECSSSSERSAPASSSPAATAKSPVCNPVGVHIGTPRSGSVQPSPPKVPGKAKWNSNVRCDWPPCLPSLPTRVAGGGAAACTPRRLAATSEARTRNVGVMTFSAISASELIKKSESLEIELDVHVGNERQLLSVNEQLRQRLEACLLELNDAGKMNLLLDDLNDEMDRILRILRHLSERNAVLEKEKAQLQAELHREAIVNKVQASTMCREGQIGDRDVDLCDADCQTVCFCQQVDTRKRRRERKKPSIGEEFRSATKANRDHSLQHS